MRAGNVQHVAVTGDTTAPGTAAIGGSKVYMSPEMLALMRTKEAKLSFSGDTFAIGVMIQALLNDSPFTVTSPKVGTVGREEMMQGI